MKELLEYLKKQRDERVKKLEAYTEALSDLEAAQKRVDSFGDIGGIEGEICELDSYIYEVELRMLTPCTAGTANIGEEADDTVAETTAYVEGQEAGIENEVVADEE